jgi:hypothetical protein
MEVLGQPPDQVTVLRVDQDSMAQHRSKVLVRPQGGGYATGRDLNMVLQLLFGLR